MLPHPINLTSDRIYITSPWRLDKWQYICYLTQETWRVVISILPQPANLMSGHIYVTSPYQLDASLYLRRVYFVLKTLCSGTLIKLKGQWWALVSVPGRAVNISMAYLFFNFLCHFLHTFLHGLGELLQCLSGHPSQAGSFQGNVYTPLPISNQGFWHQKAPSP